MSDNGFSEEDIKKLGALSRIEISDQESTALAEQLTSILQYVKKLDAYDVENTEPLSHVHGSTNVLRADEAHSYEQKKAILTQAPETSGTFIKVPLIVNQNDSDS